MGRALRFNVLPNIYICLISSEVINNIGYLEVRISHFFPTLQVCRENLSTKPHSPMCLDLYPTTDETIGPHWKIPEG